MREEVDPSQRLVAVQESKPGASFQICARLVRPEEFERPTAWFINTTKVYNLLFLLSNLCGRPYQGAELRITVQD